MERSELKQDVLQKIVKAISQLGTCNRSKVGAIIVKDGRVISTGYNGSPPGDDHCLDVGCFMIDGHCLRCIHAESNAIAWAARKGIATEGSTLYVYGWTTGKDIGICASCSKLVRSAGIIRTIIVPLEGQDAHPHS